MNDAHQGQILKRCRRIQGCSSGVWACAGAQIGTTDTVPPRFLWGDFSVRLSCRRQNCLYLKASRRLSVVGTIFTISHFQFKNLRLNFWGTRVQDVLERFSSFYEGSKVSWRKAFYDSTRFHWRISSHILFSILMYNYHRRFSMLNSNAGSD